MEIIIHRVNTISTLKDVKKAFGTEIDIRANGSKLILNHEPHSNGELFEAYLDSYNHGTLILNIKEAGIEDEVLRLVRQRENIKNYFLLDVEFPYLIRSANSGERNIAIRFSEYESIETVKKFVGKVDWVWIDTINKLPIDKDVLPVLNKFKKCLVCPERWGRSEDILLYINKLKIYKFNVTAVMTSSVYSKLWQVATI